MRIDQQNQTSNATCVNRYPEVFSGVAQLVDTTEELEILSFGCSTGEETVTIRDTFPNARITGVDVSQDALRSARENYGSHADFFHSSELPGGERFDIVFAMSVLCIYPQSKRRNGLKTLYPFERYDETLIGIDALIRPGGLLVIYNSNYRFWDSSIRKKYRYEAREKFETNGFVPKFSKNSIKMKDSRHTDVVYRKRTPKV